jgi:hypothetical protein
VLYCFVFLFLAVAGGGPWSVDRWWQTRARSAGGRSRGQTMRA